MRIMYEYSSTIDSKNGMSDFPIIDQAVSEEAGSPNILNVYEMN